MVCACVPVRPLPGMSLAAAALQASLQRRHTLLRQRGGPAQQEGQGSPRRTSACHSSPPFSAPGTATLLPILNQAVRDQTLEKRRLPVMTGHGQQQTWPRTTLHSPTGEGSRHADSYGGDTVTYSSIGHSGSSKWGPVTQMIPERPKQVLLCSSPMASLLCAQPFATSAEPYTQTPS